MKKLHTFCFPYACYQGNVKPESLIFNANLQEFSHQVSTISALETNGKITPQAAFDRIEALWQQLEQSYPTSHLDA